ncbi:MAG: antibiotic biosynthesis monooxygenase [Cyanobacteria bacterium CRU_2_1]|nr:antibiotic biosynthesis monooxygenase [Cyanobacteria bacterium RU_5_0]NJR62061.1 antibiotic biosynthesis monooxygenase [Cyanobacteria bacterium CRU_2_1]
MIVEYIRYKIADNQRDSFEQAYQQAQTSLIASVHCFGYELSQCTEDAKYYILRIEWDSEDGHLQGFRKSPEFQAFFSAVRPFVDAIEEMRHYAVTAINSKKD